MPDPFAVVAAVGLPGAPALAGPLNPDDAARVLHEATVWRLEGLLARALADGVIDGDDAFHAEAARRHRAALGTCLDLEAMLVRVAGTLDAAGVGFRVLKGPALAHLDYDDPADRTFGDIDLLVAPGRLRTAADALAARDWQPLVPPVGWSWAAQFGKSVTFADVRERELDLHRSLAEGRYGVSIDPAELFESAVWFPLGGREFPALDAPRRLLHACYHAVLGGPSRLHGLRDVAQLLLVTAADWLATVALAGRWGGEAVVAEAVRRTWADLSLASAHPAVTWAAAHRAGEVDLRAMERYRQGQFAPIVLTGLGVVPGVLAKAALIGPLVWPARPHLAARHRTRAGHLGSLARRSRR